MSIETSQISGELQLSQETADHIVPVLLPIPADSPYSYRLPGHLEKPEAGSLVRVPLGPREVAGIVWQADETSKKVDPKKLRDIEHVFECPPIGEDLRKLVGWIAQYTISPLGMVARMIMRVPAAFDPEPPLPGLRHSGRLPTKMTGARSRVLELLEEHEGMAWTRSGLAHAAGVSSSVVKGLEEQGVFDSVLIPPPSVVPPPKVEEGRVSLTSQQLEAAGELVSTVQAKGFATTLLDGITGSGKTEVYFEAIAETLKQGRQVLILLPEIALTSSFLERFESRFAAPPAGWHSGMAPRIRERTWRQVAEGQIRVVAGARSALFLPFKDLGLIIVDEEHDGAYKQEDRVFYSARDMAVVRASLANIPCILASATPSIESQVNGQNGRYEIVRLTERHGEAVLPQLATIDMRKNAPARGDFLSPPLLKAMEAALERKEQSLLFLNRRGYAPLTLCRACGFRFECQNCSAWLVEHRFRRQLQCHHCGHNEPVHEACPNCGTLDHLVACGPGVERLAEEADRHFPDARILVLSSDMAGGVSRLRLELDAIAKGQIDIVIGTQLVAKGHNFPLMTCVGVVDADIGLANGDPRAAERTFQLLSQVTGRAGRSGGASHGYLQTYAPENPVLQAIASGDRDSFYEREIALRRQANLPPFARLVSLIISATDNRETETFARQLKVAAPANKDVRILGPAEAPLALVRGRYRYRLLVHAPKGFDIQLYLRQWLEQGPKARGSLRLQIDVDPQSFL